MFNRLYLSPGKVGANAVCNYWSNLGSVHQVPIMGGWTEAVWNMKFDWHFYTWPALGIEPQTFWSWVQRLTHWAICFVTLCMPSYPPQSYYGYAHLLCDSANLMTGIYHIMQASITLALFQTRISKYCLWIKTRFLWTLSCTNQSQINV